MKPNQSGVPARTAVPGRRLRAVLVTVLAGAGIVALVARRRR
ncbi:MAG TPA: hypothetical protein VFQ77_16645 [Pseudonocardiaceae bacterium]|nr:hypothetical protein [Pseudonocardiaceae bacterium]